MIFPVSLSIFVLTITAVSPFNDPRCKRLSNGCQIKSYYCILNYLFHANSSISSLCYFYVCDKVGLNFQFSQPEMELIQNCASNNIEVRYALNNVYFRLSKASILDISFDLFNNKLFFNSSEIYRFSDNIVYTPHLQYNNNIGRKITFRYIKGFDSGIFKRLNFSIFDFDIYFEMDFYFSNFDFYLNKSLIRSCDGINLKNIPKYVFFTIPFEIALIIKFIDCEYKIKICPLLLLNMNVYSMEFNGIQNTFYKSNFPRFFPISNFTYDSRYIDGNMGPRYISLINMQNIELNSIILNEYLFSRVQELRLYGDIVSIEKGLFKSFIDLVSLELDILSARKLFHRGIDWLFDLNLGFNEGVDINNISTIDNSSRFFLLNINSISNDLRTISSLDFDLMDYFPNEDFCLYDRFPFQKLIIINFYPFELKGKDYSCTYLWFYQHVEKVYDLYDWPGLSLTTQIHKPEVDKKKIDKCNFKQR